jgi:nucleoside-diphosphate kinase
VFLERPLVPAKIQFAPIPSFPNPVNLVNPVQNFSPQARPNSFRVTRTTFSDSLPETFPDSMETSLILLKPDCLAKGHCGDVLQRFEKAGFRLRGCKMMRLTDDLLREHYAHIAAKPFFPELQTFMQSSPVVALALEAEGVVEKVRALVGPTDSRKAPAGTIRGDFGVDVMVNIVHASDSLDTARVELLRFFQPGELFD